MLVFYSHNPPLVTHTTNPVNGRIFHIIDDGSLKCGTKQRGLNFFVRLAAKGVESVFTSAADTGFGQIATSWMCKQVGIKCYILYVDRNEVTELTSKAIKYGATPIYVSRSNDVLKLRTLTQLDPPFGIDQMILSEDDIPKERDYGGVYAYMLDVAAANLSTAVGKSAVHIPLGLGSESYIDELSFSINQANIEMLKPSRIWLAVGSGSILRALAKIWPEALFLCVQVGKNIDKIDGIRMAIISHRQKFRDPVSNKDYPPFDSVATYDAKVWQHMIKGGKDGDYFWNVASDNNL